MFLSSSKTSPYSNKKYFEKTKQWTGTTGIILGILSGIHFLREHCGDTLPDSLALQDTRWHFCEVLCRTLQYFSAGSRLEAQVRGSWQETPLRRIATLQQGRRTILSKFNSIQNPPALQAAAARGGSPQTGTLKCAHSENLCC